MSYVCFSDFITCDFELWELVGPNIWWQSGYVLCAYWAYWWSCHVFGMHIYFPFIQQNTVNCNQHGTVPFITVSRDHQSGTFACWCLKVDTRPQWSLVTSRKVRISQAWIQMGVDPCLRGQMSQPRLRLTTRYPETWWLMMIFLLEILFLTSKLLCIGDDCSYFPMMYDQHRHIIYVW